MFLKLNKGTRYKDRLNKEKKDASYIGRVLNKTQLSRTNGTFRLKFS